MVTTYGPVSGSTKLPVLFERSVPMAAPEGDTNVSATLLEPVLVAKPPVLTSLSEAGCPAVPSNE
jgi:hypothetical protein